MHQQRLSALARFNAETNEDLDLFQGRGSVVGDGEEGVLDERVCGEPGGWEWRFGVEREDVADGKGGRGESGDVEGRARDRGNGETEGEYPAL